MLLSVFVLIVLCFEREPDKNLTLKGLQWTVLSDQRKVQRVDVDRVSFKIHKKIGKPDSIKVTYHLWHGRVL